MIWRLGSGSYQSAAGIFQAPMKSSHVFTRMDSGEQDALKKKFQWNAPFVDGGEIIIQEAKAFLFGQLVPYDGILAICFVPLHRFIGENQVTPKLYECHLRHFKSSLSSKRFEPVIVFRDDAP
jgi:hypothetical protein